MKQATVTNLAKADPADLKSIDYARRHWVPRNRRDKPISAATVYRWIRKGVCGVRLQVLCMPNGTVTSQAAVQNFLASVDAAKQSKTTALDVTEEQLRAAGLLR